MHDRLATRPLPQFRPDHLPVPVLEDPTLTTTVEERRLMAARARLDRARELVRSAEADLDGQLAAIRRAALDGEDPAGPFDPDDATLLEEVHADLLEARDAARGRRRRPAEKQVLALELAQRLILGRLGCASYEEYRARRDASAEQDREIGQVVIDLAYLEYAREEHERAQRDWAELSAGQPLPVRRRP